MGRHVQVSGFLVEAFLTSLLLFFHQKDKNQLKMRESQREEKTREMEHNWEKHTFWNFSWANWRFAGLRHCCLLDCCFFLAPCPALVMHHLRCCLNGPAHQLRKQVQLMWLIQPMKKLRFGEPQWLPHVHRLGCFLFQLLALRWDCGLNYQHQICLGMIFLRSPVAVFRTYNETRKTWHGMSRGGSYLGLESNCWVNEMIEQFSIRLTGELWVP